MLRENGTGGLGSGMHLMDEMAYLCTAIILSHVSFLTLDFFVVVKLIFLKRGNFVALGKCRYL